MTKDSAPTPVAKSSKQDASSPGLKVYRPGATTQPALGATVSGEHHELITGIEADIKAERAKPLGEQELGQFIERFAPIAEQSEDAMAQAYAKARTEQLESYVEMIEAAKRLDELSKGVQSLHERGVRERMQIKVAKRRTVGPLEIRGRFQVSGVYDPASKTRPQRFRIVDPKSTRTLAYVELSPQSRIDPTKYYGRMVAVRADRREYIGTVHPTPILKPGSDGGIRLIAEKDEADDKAAPTPTSSRGRKTDFASPKEPAAPAPATRGQREGEPAASPATRPAE